MQTLTFAVPDDKAHQVQAAVAVLLQTSEERKAKVEDLKAKALARMTPERRAEYERIGALAPSVRKAETLLRQKVAIEEQLRSGPAAEVLADADALAAMAPEMAAEAGGFLLRGTVVKEGG